MAFEQSIQSVSGPANASLTTKQYYAVVFNSSGNIAVAGAGVPIAGVLQNAPASGDGAEVAVSGISKVALGGTATAGTMAAVDSAGKFLNAVSGDIAVGVFVKGGSSGEVGSMLVKDIGKIW